MQRLLLGGVFALAVCGAATAKPPTGPLSEGREPDPVVREYYHGDAPTPPAETDAPRTAPDAPDTSAWPLLTTFNVLDSVMNGVKLPLGPCMTDV